MLVMLGRRELGAHAAADDAGEGDDQRVHPRNSVGCRVVCMGSTPHGCGSSSAAGLALEKKSIIAFNSTYVNGF